MIKVYGRRADKLRRLRQDREEKRRNGALPASNESAEDFLRTGKIPAASNEHLRGLQGGNNGSFGEYRHDEAWARKGPQPVREELRRSEFTVSAGEMKAAFTPSHYESWLQICRKPQDALECYTRYLELEDMKRVRPLTSEEYAEWEELRRMEQMAVEYDEARRYMRDKGNFSQQDVDFAFSLKNRTGTDVRENLTDTGDAAAAQYQSMFFDRIFGGMKEEYLKDESDGGIPRAAIRALEEGGDSEEMRDIRDLGGLMEWLDRYLARQTESGKAGMMMILRAIRRSNPAHGEESILLYLEKLLGSIYFREMFRLTDSDPRMVCANLYLRRALEALMRNPGSAFAGKLRLLLAMVMSERVQGA